MLSRGSPPGGWRFRAVITPRGGIFVEHSQIFCGNYMLLPHAVRSPTVEICCTRSKEPREPPEGLTRCYPPRGLKKAANSCYTDSILEREVHSYAYGRRVIGSGSCRDHVCRIRSHGRRFLYSKRGDQDIAQDKLPNKADVIAIRPADRIAMASALCFLIHPRFS